jgi:bis(5'-nucleosyl)-tetraphosphatase (symmetrical)
LQQPLTIEYKNSLLVHAGIPPNWGKNEVLNQTLSVQNSLQSENAFTFIQSLYTDKPNIWQNNMPKLQQQIYTVNALMRMRFCDAFGRLELSQKQGLEYTPKGYKAWFLHPRKTQGIDIYFGHWSSLKNPNIPHIHPLDTGCIWGGKLSALEINRGVIFTQSCD